jgi:hypothetical protein
MTTQASRKYCYKTTRFWRATALWLKTALLPSSPSEVSISCEHYFDNREHNGISPQRDGYGHYEVSSVPLIRQYIHEYLFPRYHYKPILINLSPILVHEFYSNFKSSCLLNWGCTKNICLGSCTPKNHSNFDVIFFDQWIQMVTIFLWS